MSLWAVLFSKVVCDHEGTGGNMKKKCGRLIFIVGEKSGVTFNWSDFWNVVQKGGLSLSPSLQREILCQLEDIMQYIYNALIMHLLVVSDFQLWLKRYWPSKSQNIRKFFRLSSFSVNNNSDSNSSSNHYFFI